MVFFLANIVMFLSCHKVWWSGWSDSPEPTKIHWLSQVEGGHRGWWSPGYKRIWVQLEASFQPIPDYSDFVPGIESYWSENWLG